MPRFPTAAYSSSGYLSACSVCSGAIIFPRSSFFILFFMACSTHCSFCWPAFAQNLCGFAHSLRVLWVRAAAAEVAGECFPYLLLGRIRIPVEQSFCGNDKARRTVTALHAVVFD